MPPSCCSGVENGKKESPNLEICLLFITLISKILAGLSVQTVMNRKINCHRSFNGAGRLE